MVQGASSEVSGNKEALIDHIKDVSFRQEVSPSRSFGGTETDLISAANGRSLQKSKGDDQCDDDEEETVESDQSVGGLSHVSDGGNLSYHYQASLVDEEEEIDGPALGTRVNNWMRRFFLSKRYSFVTHIGGSMGCFFVIGMRVEGFLKKQCIVPPNDFSWELQLKVSFWLIVSSMLMFLVFSSWKILLFPVCSRIELEEAQVLTDKRVQWIQFLAAALDIIVSFVCLTLFFGAEIQRCCNGDEYSGIPGLSSSYPDENNLADTKEGNFTNNWQSGYENPDNENRRYLAGGYDTYEDDAPQMCENETVYCNCPRFGTRLEGGLGKIEPFVSLVLIRMFRFILAKKIVMKFDLGSDIAVQNKDDSVRNKRFHAGLISDHGGHGMDRRLKQGTGRLS
jgi:hypothetical protein